MILIEFSESFCRKYGIFAEKKDEMLGGNNRMKKRFCHLALKINAFLREVDILNQMYQELSMHNKILAEEANLKKERLLAKIEEIVVKARQKVSNETPKDILLNTRKEIELHKAQEKAKCQIELQTIMQKKQAVENRKEMLKEAKRALLAKEEKLTLALKIFTCE